MPDTQHTFCVAAYGESPYLDDCLSSIKKQTAPSSILVCTSTPNEYIRKLADKYGAIYRVSNNVPGIGRDWNFAYQCSTSPLVTVAHQDDIYSPEYTAKCLEGLSRNDTSLIIFTDYAQLINNKIYTWSIIALIKRLLVSPFWFRSYYGSKLLKKSILIFGNPIACGSVMFNRAVIGENFYFDENMKTNLDWLAWLSLAKKEGAFYRVPSVLYYHRLHGDSATSKTIIDHDRYREDLFILQEIWGRSVASLIMRLYKLSHSLNTSKIS